MGVYCGGAKQPQDTRRISPSESETEVYNYEVSPHVKEIVCKVLSRIEIYVLVVRIP